MVRSPIPMSSTKVPSFPLMSGMSNTSYICRIYHCMESDKPIGNTLYSHRPWGNATAISVIGSGMGHAIGWIILFTGMKFTQTRNVPSFLATRSGLHETGLFDFCILSALDHGFDVLVQHFDFVLANTSWSRPWAVVPQGRCEMRQEPVAWIHPRSSTSLLVVENSLSAARRSLGSLPSVRLLLDIHVVVEYVRGLRYSRQEEYRGDVVLRFLGHEFLHRDGFEWMG
ncbi:MAG: hypothetical protein J3R72DRAFT_116939 [Linnemannia gamsii]|nr:MAG: hypothetical protein J3R72DRAFT_116939 [Linnemannia gamsii]